MPSARRCATIEELLRDSEIQKRCGTAPFDSPIAAVPPVSRFRVPIFACATEHKLDLAHDDGHFTPLEELGA